MKLRSLRIAFGLLLLGVALVPGAAQASGFSPGHLAQQGWQCYYFEPQSSPFLPVPGVYCMPPGDDMATAAVNTGRIFDTTDPNDMDAPFTGLGVAIRADLYHGQPCPTNPDPEGRYIGFGDAGDGTPARYICYRFSPE